MVGFKFCFLLLIVIGLFLLSWFLCRKFGSKGKKKKKKEENEELSVLDVVYRLKETFSDLEDEFFVSFLLSEDPNKVLTNDECHILADKITRAALIKMDEKENFEPKKLLSDLDLNLWRPTSKAALARRKHCGSYVKYTFKPDREFDFNCPIENHVRMAELQFVRMSNTGKPCCCCSLPLLFKKVLAAVRPKAASQKARPVPRRQKDRAAADGSCGMLVAALLRRHR